MSWLTALMNRFSLTRKFVVVGIVITLSTIFLAYLLFRTSQTDISFAQQERLGVDYVANLPDLLAKVEHFRDLQLRAAAGDVDAHPATAANDVDNAFARLDAADQRIGNALGVHGDFQTLREQWNSVRNAPPSPDAAAQAGDLVAAVGSLPGTVCDKSNLSLDPVMASYYLVDSFCTQLPGAIGHIGRQRAVTGEAVVRAHLDDASRTQLIELRPLARQAVDAASGDMDKVFSAEAALKPMLSDSMSALSDANRKVSDTMQQQALSGALVVSGNRVAAQADVA